jgi:hypothetical protein
MSIPIRITRGKDYYTNIAKKDRKVMQFDVIVETRSI